MKYMLINRIFSNFRKWTNLLAVTKLFLLRMVSTSSIQFVYLHDGKSLNRLFVSSFYCWTEKIRAIILRCCLVNSFFRLNIIEWIQLINRSVIDKKQKQMHSIWCLVESIDGAIMQQRDIVGIAQSAMCLAAIVHVCMQWIDSLTRVKDICK